MGILLSIGALDSAGILQQFSTFLQQTNLGERAIATAIGEHGAPIIVTIIIIINIIIVLMASDLSLSSLSGLASAVIDNVPLVAATMGMYDMSSNPQDSQLWQLIAYCAGTGGSLLVSAIDGSA
jgi:Na+/H+ antiporter NhaD/arsenite permease-like protein